MLYEALAGTVHAWHYVWGPFQLLVLWALVFHALWVFADNAWLLHRIGRDEVRVDLEDLTPLDVFANAGLRYLLLFVGGLVVIPAQGILAGGMASHDFVPALVVVLPAAALLFALPVRRPPTR